jgi:GT2 family glycosyltransferase
MYAEDVDLCRAILERGWKLYYLSTAEIIHVAGGTSEKAPSGFSILMKSESIAKFMRKYHGASGALVYRLATLVGSGFRLGILGLLRVLAVFSAAARRREIAVSFFKHRTLLLWSLGLQKPVIAT